MAALRQVVRSGFCKYRAVSAHPVSGTSRLNYFRQISQLVKPNGNCEFPVDTSALAKSLEAQGVPQKQAEAIASAMKDSLENLKEHHFSLLQLETKKLRGDMEKMRSELRYEPDKVIDGQRPELDLEIGRMRDELANQNAQIKSLRGKLGLVRAMAFTAYLYPCVWIIMEKLGI